MTSSSFSTVLKIADLNDFIAPSQDCIKPFKEDHEPKNSELQVNVHRREGNNARNEGKTPVKITLSDCLACSGCITSAESVFVEQQSHHELYRALQEFSLNLSSPTVVVSISPQARISLAIRYGLSQMDAQMKLASFFKSIGAHYVFDSSIARDLSVIESSEEFIRRSHEGLPILCSICPGWVCYVEKSHPWLVPYLSTVKSAQGIMGALVKRYLPKVKKLTSSNMYHVTVEPCFDRKLEAVRVEDENWKDVDCVITPVEIEQMLEKAGNSLAEYLCSDIDYIIDREREQALYTIDGSGSGGYAHQVFQHAARILHGIEQPPTFVVGRNADISEAVLEKNGEVIMRFAVANGFRNIQNLIQKIKRKTINYQYVEVMACPSGCLNGGAQSRPQEGETAKGLLSRVKDMYEELPKIEMDAHEPARFYRDWITGLEDGLARQILHTKFRPTESQVSGSLVGSSLKW